MYVEFAEISWTVIIARKIIAPLKKSGLLISKSLVETASRRGFVKGTGKDGERVKNLRLADFVKEILVFHG